jgi:hypothetical protein
VLLKIVSGFGCDVGGFVFMGGHYFSIFGRCEMTDVFYVCGENGRLRRDKVR